MPNHRKYTHWAKITIKRSDLRHLKGQRCDTICVYIFIYNTRITTKLQSECARDNKAKIKQKITKSIFSSFSAEWRVYWVSLIVHCCQAKTNSVLSTNNFVHLNVGRVDLFFLILKDILFCFCRFNIVFFAVAYAVPVLCMTVAYTSIGFVLWSSKVIGENTPLQRQVLKSRQQVSYFQRVLYRRFLIMTYFQCFSHLNFSIEIIKIASKPFILLVLKKIKEKMACFT